MRYLLMILSVAAGAVLPVQGSINGRLGKSIDSAVYASFCSFLIGTVALLLYIVSTQSQLKVSGLRSVPVYEWSGGLMGAFYVLAVILIIPRLGAALTFSLIVAGQMIVSIVLDQIGFLGTPSHPVNIPRILGLALVIGGVILVRKF